MTISPASTQAEPVSHAEPDLRAWLEVQRARGRLATVSRRVDPRFEFPALLSKLDGSRMLFASDAGDERSVTGNSAVCREDFARALDCPWRELTETLLRIGPATSGGRCVTVSPESRHRCCTPRIERMVVCTHHERDQGPYLTSGILMVTDPDEDRENWSINRLQVAGPRTFHALVQAGNARRAIERHWARERDAPVVIACGVHPLALLASQLRGPEPRDGLATYGALCGAPLQTAIMPATGVEVPARAEWLLEGRIALGRRGREGPFGEFPRTYGAPHEDGLIIEIEAMWHRDDPISQTILPAGREHLLLGGLAREAAILGSLRRSGFAVAAVRLTEGGACRFHAVVGCREAEQPLADLLEAVVSADPLVKHVLLVDDDIDVHDVGQLEWALSTRFRADRDMLVLADRAGTKLDPASDAGRVAKLGMDARVGSRDHLARKRISIPGAESMRLSDYLDRSQRDHLR